MSTSAHPAPAPPTSPPGRRRRRAGRSSRTTFRTGASTTSVTIYTHGWYGTPAYAADDLSLLGPGGDPVQIPAAPTGLTAGTPGSTSVPLTWSPVSGATALQRLPGRHQGPVRHRDFGHRHRARALHRRTASRSPRRTAPASPRSPPPSPRRPPAAAAAGTRPARPRPRRLSARQLRQRLRLYAHGRRARLLGRHQPRLRRTDLGHLGRHPLQPLPGDRVPERRVATPTSRPPIKAKQAAGKKVLISIGGAERPGAAHHHGRP